LLLDIRRLGAETHDLVQALASRQQADHRQLVEILRFVHDRAQWRRRELQRLRSSADYERAFQEAEPLISVVIPTYDNHALLRERSIPSVLAQTYQNFEVVVVGDAAPEEARVAVESFNDSRITFFNRPYRGPYPAEPELAWTVSGVPPVNEAVQRATGLWIAPLADDDAFLPDHLEQLLALARRDRLELAYGRAMAHFADGSELAIGSFPPELGQFAMQAAIYHAGIAEIFQYELADAAFGMPSDWAFGLRTMEAGVRIGMLDKVTVDYYPSKSWRPRWIEGENHGPSVTDQIAPRPETL
jgi:glycosyltransferase involved in cell wall biosynthesis